MVCYGGGRTGRKLARIFRKQPSHSSSSESTEIRISLQGQCSILSRSQVRDWYISTSSLCKFVAVVVTQANFSWGHNMKLVKVIVTFTLELIYFFAQSNIENLRISIVCPLACFLAVIFWKKIVVSRLSLFPVRSCYFLRFAFLKNVPCNYYIFILYYSISDHQLIPTIFLE